MLILKRLLSRIVYLFGITKFLKKIGNREPMILVYHRIMDKSPEYEFDSRLFSASKQNFDTQMKYLSENYNVVPLEKLLDCKNIPKNAIAITFDDGYADNYDNAYPSLRKYNLPATIFLATDYIDEEKIFWWDKLAYIINNSKATQVSLSIGVFSMKKKDTIARLTNYLKKSSDVEKERLLSELAEKAQVECAPAPLTLTWDNIVQMSNNQIEFGAHTKSHSILTKMPAERAHSEIYESKKIIESKLGRPVKFFSYPNGYNSDYNQEIKEMVASAGYEGALTYIPGFAGKDNMELKRVFVKYEEDMVDFKNKLNGFDNIAGNVITLLGR